MCTCSQVGSDVLLVTVSVRDHQVTSLKSRSILKTNSSYLLGTVVIQHSAKMAALGLFVKLTSNDKVIAVFINFEPCFFGLFCQLLHQSIHHRYIHMNNTVQLTLFWFFYFVFFTSSWHTLQFALAKVKCETCSHLPHQGSFLSYLMDNQ